MLVAVSGDAVNVGNNNFSIAMPLGGGNASYGADKPVFDEQFVYMTRSYVKRTFGVVGPEFPTMEMGPQVRAMKSDYQRWLKDVFKQAMSFDSTD